MNFWLWYLVICEGILLLIYLQSYVYIKTNVIEKRLYKISKLETLLSIIKMMLFILIPVLNLGIAYVSFFMEEEFIERVNSDIKKRNLLYEIREGLKEEL